MTESKRPGGLPPPYFVPTYKNTPFRKWTELFWEQHAKTECGKKPTELGLLHAWEGGHSPKTFVESLDHQYKKALLRASIGPAGIER